MSETIIKRLKLFAKQEPEKIFATIKHDSQCEIITYESLFNQVMKISSYMNQTFKNNRDIIIIMLPLSSEQITSFLGAISSGLIPTIFPTNFSKVSFESLRSTMEKTIKLTRAKYLVTTPELADKFFKNQKTNIQIITSTDWSSVSSSFSYINSEITSSDVAFLQHSSGTTGLKKGVAITHQALLDHIDKYADFLKLNQDDKISSWLPLYHDMGLITSLFLPLLRKISISLLDPFEWITAPEEFIIDLSINKSTFCWMPNFAFSLLGKKTSKKLNDQIDLSHLKAVINCSEPITKDAISHFYSKYGQYGLKETSISTCYGMAENTFAVTQSIPRQKLLEVEADLKIFTEQGIIASPEKNGKSRTLISSGIPVGKTEIKIVDDKNIILKEKHVGEIIIKSPYMLSEYYARDDLTREAIDSGWFKTGDLGFKYKNNYFITGRKKDLMIISGKNIYPGDIEEVISDIDGIYPGRVAVFGIFNKLKGTEDVIVLAEIAISEKVKRNDLKLEILNKVSRLFECKISKIDFHSKNTLIKSTSGKISRIKCKKSYLEKSRKKSETSLANEMGRIVPQFIVLEVCLHLIALIIPSVVFFKAQENNNLFLYLIFFLSIIYLYPFVLGMSVAILIHLFSKPAMGKLHYKSDYRRYAYLLFLDALINRTLAKEMIWLNPFPASFYHKITGAKIHHSVRIGSADTIHDPYLISIGKNSLIGNRSYLSGHYVPNTEYVFLGTITIGENVLIGKDCTIWPDVKIESNAIVQERSSVMPGTTIPENQIWGGTPARPICNGPLISPSVDLQHTLINFIKTNSNVELDSFDHDTSLYELGILDSLALCHIYTLIEKNISNKTLKQHTILEVTLNDLLKEVSK